METRHVGWNSTYNQAYYDPSVIQWISHAVMLKTYHLNNRPINVTPRIIEHVLDMFLSNHRSFTGDIYTRYHIPGDGNFSGDFGRLNAPLVDQIHSNTGLSSNYIINQVVEFISEYITTEHTIKANNERYSIWSTLYGANNVGLQAHPQLKIREKRPSPFQFHMRF